MDLHRGLAERSEAEPSPHLQAVFAGRYREIIGVPPERRTEFREALERVRDGGGMDVQDVLDLIRLRAQANGSGSVGGEAAASPPRD